MKNKYESLFEGIRTEENKTLLNRIYTQLYIIEGESEGVNEEHEVLQMEKTSRRHLQDSPINCSDIFKPLQGPEGETLEGNIRAVKADSLRHKEREEDNRPKEPELRSVLTKGIAGIGKTVSVQKFILDWAEGKANQDVELMFVLPFRELNLIKDDQYSLHGLLCDFHPELKDLDPEIYDQLKAVFVFDGLDESRIPLNFKQCKKVSDITMASSVGVLMTNLIKGELLPSALIWMTSRPAAANLIPPKYISRVTEVQGFNDPQKEEYFRKRISDEDQAKRIISHIKTVRSLHIMCHIPVFCWISATVFQQIIKQSHTEIPKTLTEMYSHFLLTQTNMKNEKYEEKKRRNPKNLLESNRTIILKLAELAFKQLMKGNVMFYEEDLRESSIDVTEASVYSGIFTEIFREECVLYQRKVYCFVHLSFQEFLAAVYVFHCYESKNMEELQIFNPRNRERSKSKDLLDELLKGAVNKAVKSQNGHLDLFLRFLLGISLKSNQRHLQGLLTPTQSSSERTRQHMKKLIKGEDKRYPISTERSINLFLCLSEMNDQSLSREIQEYLNSERHSGEKLSPGQCSALACMLLTSEKVLDELDLKKYNTSEEGYRRLIPALTFCRKALLAWCGLTTNSCENLSSALQSVNSSLKELDLSNNDLQDSGVELLSAGLKSSHCKLEILRLSGCMVTDEGCSSLASALKSNPSHLRELDLTYNHPGESGVKLLSDLLEDPQCKLEKLHTHTAVSSCSTLAEPHFEELRACSLLRSPAPTPPPTPASRPEWRRHKRYERKQKRGKRGGIRARLAASPHKPAIPTIVLANVRSLDNKLDYIRLLRTTQKSVRDCCVFVFTETWLSNNILDHAIQLERLTCYRVDRALVEGDWNVFKQVATYNNTTYLQEYADSITGYISKCIEDVTVLKPITVQANQKPWLTGEVYRPLKARNAAFSAGDKVGLKAARNNLFRGIRKAKRQHNNLYLNIEKTKEIVVDFWRMCTQHASLTINGAAVERVNSIKFLGVHVTEDLSWTNNTASLARRAHQHLYFLRN
ncbi:NLR family CARD domain-containing protein 3-like [Colossoma macropomum]|uniref:NLR family CARD domain-containing protein 3-like n=1 Tax=Colossoma macropomum TaxID=42526 RepID=UPI001863CCB3|nr:NLR family CARD domain-containing protein 3-like [Colossoma macropomum]